MGILLVTMVLLKEIQLKLLKFQKKQYENILEKYMTNRIEHDHYPTPMWMTEQLIEHACIFDGSIFEPCAGKDHAIANVFKDKCHEVFTNDLNFESQTMLDAGSNRNWKIFSKCDWVVSNPPFNDHLNILMNAVKHARIGVAFLLRVTADEMVMANQERCEWWVNNPESLVIKMPRYSFARSSKTGKMSVDSAYCQWMVWRNDGYIYDRSVIRLPHYQIPNFTRKPEGT